MSDLRTDPSRMDIVLRSPDLPESVIDIPVSIERETFDPVARESLRKFLSAQTQIISDQWAGNWPMLPQRMYGEGAHRGKGGKPQTEDPGTQQDSVFQHNADDDWVDTVLYSMPFKDLELCIAEPDKFEWTVVASLQSRCDAKTTMFHFRNGRSAATPGARKPDNSSNDDETVEGDAVIEDAEDDDSSEDDKSDVRDEK